MLFTGSELAGLRSAFERLYRGELDHRDWPYVPPVISEASDGIRTALFSAFVSKTIEAAVSKPVLVEMAARLMGVDRVRYWQDQAIWKPGTHRDTDAGNIGFHQDFAYWQDSSTTNMISANIALQDVPANRGCLRVFPGSHRFGLLADTGGDFFNTDLASLRARFLEATGCSDHPLELAAGQVSFHHALLVHGSGPNATNTDRLVLAPAYMPDGTYHRVEGQPPCPHSNFLGRDREHGTRYDGMYFPLLSRNVDGL